MPSRRFHTKSRHGCVQCKARRVKCDSLGSTCSACIRRHLDCSLTSLKNSLILVDHLFLSHAAITLDAINISPEDANIMHHYSMTFSGCISELPSLRKAFNTAVASEGTSEPQIWHGVLALSALHLLQCQASCNRTVNYKKGVTALWSTALHHHALALSAIRPRLTSPSPASAIALFLLSATISTFTLACAHTDPAQPPGSATATADPIAETLAIAAALRGVQAVSSSTRPWLAAGPLAAFTQVADPGLAPNNTTYLQPDTAEALARLSQRNAAAPQDEDARALCADAIAALGARFRARGAKGDFAAMVPVWTVMMGRGFWELVAARNAMALVVLAHYGVLLHGVRECWWAGGRGAELVMAVLGELDEGWRGWVEWPVEKIGGAWDGGALSI